MHPSSFRISRVILTIALSASLAGCAMTFDARALGVSATMASPAAQPAAGDTFTVTAHAVHIFWGAYPVRLPDLKSALAGQITGNQTIADLRIRVRKTIPDLIFTVLTVGFVQPTAVTFQGVIVTPAAAPGGP